MGWSPGELYGRGKVRCPMCGRRVYPRRNGEGTFLGLPRHNRPEVSA